MVSQAGIRANVLKLLGAAGCIGVFCAVAAGSYALIGGHRSLPVALLSEPATTGSIAPAPPPPPEPVIAEAPPPPPPPAPAPAALADLDSAALARLIGSDGAGPAPKAPPPAKVRQAATEKTPPRR